MINVYIWNTEYEVFITSAESVSEARQQLKYRWYQDQIDYCSNPDCDIQTNLNRAKSVVHIAQSFFDKINNEPDIILKEKESKIYDHANE